MGMRQVIEVCGPKACQRVNALVSTGVKETAISRHVAKRLGLPARGHSGATIELIPKGGCGRTTQPVVIDDALAGRWGNETGVVLGWQYMTNRKAQNRLLSGRQRHRLWALPQTGEARVPVRP